MPRYEPLAPEAHRARRARLEAARREIGVQFDEPRALELFRAAGQDGRGRPRASSTRSSCCEQVAKAPSEFTVHARNPAHDVHIGGDRMMFLPAQGRRSCASATSGATARSPISSASSSWRRCSHELDTPGGNICEPDDVPLDSRHLVQTLALIVHSDKICQGHADVAHVRARTPSAWPRSCSAGARRSSSGR